jgi:iduronate 2-sulfatase
VEWKRPGAPADSAIIELYDYQTDPQETKNVANDQPGIVKTLRQKLAALPEAKPQLQSPEPAAKTKAKQKKNKKANPV